jgi:hypothetical protein
MRRLVLMMVLLGASLACWTTGSASAVSATSRGVFASRAGSAAYPFPKRASSNRRYLVDQRGRPYMIVGDSPQALVVKLSLEDAEKFIANRATAGFNALWVNLLCNDSTGGVWDGSTIDGVRPFRRYLDVSTPNLSTPNELYFRRVDAILTAAARHGITVFLNPIETIGYTKALLQNGPAKDFAYGRYLGRRYAMYPNIVWMHGNDFGGWHDARTDTAALAVARGIRAGDKSHLQTVEFAPPVSGSSDDVRWQPLVGLSAAYTYYPTYAEVLKEYSHEPHVPTFMVEASYEFEHDWTGPETLRRQEYWAMLSGATGQLYGNKYTWQFIPGWKRHLDTMGVAELGYLKKLFLARSWFNLQPDQNHRMVTAGYGVFNGSGTVNESDYVAAARTPDGRLGIAYLPTPRTLELDLRAFRGSVKAQWYDPTSGTFSTASGSPFTNGEPASLTPPGRNRGGGSDWVLVLSSG